MWGLLLGESNAVMLFNRSSKFVEALGRRMLMLMWTMFFDDGGLLDLSLARGQGQIAIACLLTWGPPWLPPNSRSLNPMVIGSVLSTTCLKTSVMVLFSFWPRERHCLKIRGLVAG